MARLKIQTIPGYIGQGVFSSKDNRRVYLLWKRILQRCYGKINKSNLAYKAVMVDERWHNFQNFASDIRFLEGYEEWLCKNSTYHLDKDILSEECKKIYSKDTCIFVKDKENYKNKKLTLTGLKYKAIRLSDNYEEEFANQTEFARKWGLVQQSLNRAISNKKTIKAGALKL